VNPRNFSFTTLKIVCSYSVFIFIGMVATQINWNAGQFIIGIFLGSKEVAIYSIAMIIDTSFISLASAIRVALLPKITKMVSLGATNIELADEMIKIGRLQQYIIFLVLAGFILFGQSFIYFWAGKDYGDAYVLTLLSMFPLSILLIQNLGLNIMQAKNKYAFKAIITLIGAILTIIISIFTVKKFGYYGVAFATGVMILLTQCIIMNIYYQKKLGLDIKRFWGNIFKISTPLFLLFLVSYAIKFYFGLNGKMHLFLGIPIFTILYCIISYFLSMNRYEKDIIYSIFNKIKNR
ncbi:MAG: oligosaccharide flippase family protein, partial [Campylobacter sp.]|nr:oligosaccharide flippase family protein [Campylobacter sp.]